MDAGSPDLGGQQRTAEVCISPVEMCLVSTGGAFR